MSVQTRVDECLEVAKQNIEDASTNLFESIKNGTWGYDLFSDEYVDRMHIALIKLLEIKKLLK